MAGLRTSLAVAPVATNTNTNLTLAQIVAAGNTRVRVERIRVTGKGNTATDYPCLIEVLKQTTAGTASAGTIVKLNDNDDETPQSTAQITFTVEPTAGNVKSAQHVHPQTSYDFVYPPGRDLYIKGGERLGVRVNTPAQGATFACQIEMEE